MSSKSNPMTEAVLAGRQGEALQLLQSDLSLVNLFNEAGLTPLVAACRRQDLKVIDALLRAGALLNLASQDALKESPLHAAVRAEGASVDLCRRLVAIGAELNARDGEGSTPLHIAIAKGSTDLVMMLVEEGADPAMKDQLKRTAFDVAQQHRRDDLVRLLRQALHG